MARRSQGRHGRPSTRGRSAAVTSELESELARLRAASFSDYMELVRLSALVDGLLAQVERLSLEIPQLRRELHHARTAAPPHDPRVDLLASEVQGLRATVSSQQSMLTDLTRQVLDLLSGIALAAPAATSSAIGVDAGSAATSPALEPAPASAPLGSNHDSALVAPTVQEVDDADLHLQLLQMSGQRRI